MDMRNQLVTLKPHIHNRIGIDKVHAEQFKTSLYELAEEVKEFKPRSVVNKRLKALDDREKAHLPKMESIITNMGRRKSKGTAKITEPTIFEELNLESFDDFVDDKGQKLARSIIAEPSKIIVFGTNSNVELLSKCPVWLVDCTFKAVPMSHIFKALLVIMGLFDGEFLPLMFILMTSLKTDDYVRVIEELPLNARQCYIIMDFERAQLKAWISALKDMQLGAKVHGCRFHFSQAIMKKVKQLHLLNEYKQRGELYRLIRSISMLPIVPVDDVKLAFSLIKREIMRLRPELAPLVGYFEKTWIGIQRDDGTYSSPIYSPDIWSCFLIVLRGIPTSNNALEAFHRAFQYDLGIVHPSVSLFMRKLVDEHTRIDFLLSRPVSEHVEPRLLEIVEEYYMYRNILNYLDDLVDI